MVDVVTYQLCDRILTYGMVMYIIESSQENVYYRTTPTLSKTKVTNIQDL